MEYSKQELTTLVRGAFQCSPKELAFYGAVNGTFLNQQQYDALPAKAKADYEKFDNPFVKEAEEKTAKATAKETAKAEKEAKAVAEAAAKAEKEAAAQAEKEAKAAAKAAKK